MLPVTPGSSWVLNLVTLWPAWRPVDGTLQTSAPLSCDGAVGEMWKQLWSLHRQRPSSGIGRKEKLSGKRMWSHRETEVHFCFLLFYEYNRYASRAADKHCEKKLATVWKVGGAMMTHRTTSLLDKTTQCSYTHTAHRLAVQFHSDSESYHSINHH